MMKFQYVTGTPVWIAPEYVVSVKAGDDDGVTLIRTVNGQFAVEGAPETILAILEGDWVDGLDTGD